jgi:hypothetical protein
MRYVHLFGGDVVQVPADWMPAIRAAIRNNETWFHGTANGTEISINLKFVTHIDHHHA